MCVNPGVAPPAVKSCLKVDKVTPQGLRQTPIKGRMGIRFVMRQVIRPGATEEPTGFFVGIPLF